MFFVRRRLTDSIARCFCFLQRIDRTIVISDHTLQFKRFRFAVQLNKDHFQKNRIQLQKKINKTVPACLK